MQSLILVEQPYFNEPGFETRPDAKVACNAYNQALRYHTMEVAMLDSLRNPDPDMNAVIRMHFRGKRAHILRQCKQYVYSGMRISNLRVLVYRRRWQRIVYF